MRSLKLMILGAMLIVLGPLMLSIDVSWNGFFVVCWFIGIPALIAGLILPANGGSTPAQDPSLPQKQCPNCSQNHDFDYPKCPHCGYDYQAKQVK